MYEHFSCWLPAVQSRVRSDLRHSHMYPHYPGRQLTNMESPILCRNENMTFLLCPRWPYTGFGWILWFCLSCWGCRWNVSMLSQYRQNTFRSPVVGGVRRRKMKFIVRPSILVYMCNVKEMINICIVRFYPKRKGNNITARASFHAVQECHTPFKPLLLSYK